MQRCYILATGLALALGVCSSALAANLVGATTGHFDVNPSGAATYTIPIEAPPGTAGMAPDLALRYSSQAGDSSVGIGWQLTGLSHISRCAANVEPDGFNGAVRFDSDDRLCLDGARLVAISGTYGQSGTEYRSELDPFKRVTQHGGDYNSASVWFQVHTRDGLVKNYGQERNSSFVVPGKTYSLKWGVNRIADHLGSYMDIHYAYDTTQRERYLHRIDYTGNTNTGLLPYNSVQFEYETRPDRSEQYVVGGSERIHSTRRLKFIKTYADSAAVRRYQLDYEISPSSGRSRMTSLQECGAGSSGWDCFPATEFQWSDVVPGWTQSSALLPPDSVYALGGQAIDINGDGRTDLFQAPGYTYATQTWIHTQNGDALSWVSHAGYTPPRAMYEPHSGRQMALLADVNGDGLPDYIFADSQAATQTWINTGSGWTLDNRYNLPHALLVQGKFMGAIQDVNGDGLADIVYAGAYGINETWGVFESGTYLNTGLPCSGAGCVWQRTTAYDAPQHASEDEYLYVDGAPQGTLRDVNGDGLPDFIVSYARFNDANTPVNRTYLNTGAGWQLSATYTLPAPLTMVEADGSHSPVSDLIDMNGDGLVDIACAISDSNGLGVHGGSICGSAQVIGDGVHRASYINTGAGFVADATFNLPGAISYRGLGMANKRLGQFIDFNGDGRPDFVHATSGTDKALINRSVDVCTTESCRWQVDTAWAPPFRLYYTVNGTHIGQFSLDGRPDLIHAEYQVARKTYLSNGNGIDGGMPDLLHSITPPDKLAPAVTVHYSTPLDSRRYTPGEPSAFPERRQSSTRPVVRQTNDGQGALTYSYEDLRFDAHRRSHLGFGAVVRQGALMNRRIEYAHAFPYTRMPVRIVEDWKETVNTLAVQSTGSGAAKRYFTYVSVADEKLFDAHHQTSPFLTTRIEATYDSFGNQATETTTRFTGTSPGPDAHVSELVNQYLNDTTIWLLGRQTHSSETRSHGSSPSITRENAFEYDPGTRLLTATITEPNHPTLTSRVDITHDSYGNILTTTVSGADITPRTTTATWDSRGQFQTSTSNALGHTEHYAYSPRHGEMISHTAPHAQQTVRSHDAVGRVVNIAFPHGRSISTTYARCDGAPCHPNQDEYLLVRSAGSDGIDQFEIIDAYGWTIETGEIRQNETVRQHTAYDRRGRMTYQSRPRATYLYDSHDRVTSVERSWPGGQRGGAKTVISYSGLHVNNLDPLGNESHQQLDQSGAIIKTTDAKNGVTHFSYDVYGNVVSVTNANGNISTYEYDLLGRKVSSNDSVMGQWSYQYNVLGELLEQSDAENKITSFTYDLLGRLVERDEAGNVFAWTYDTRWIGQLSRKTAPHGFDHATHDYADFARDYYYNDNGQIEEERTQIGDELYSEFRTYDTHGRLSTLTYPSGLSIRHEYSSSGYLKSIVNDTSELVYWQSVARDDWGMISGELLGNGIKACRGRDMDTGHITDIIANFGQGQYHNSYYSNPCSSSNAGNGAQATHYMWDKGGNLSLRLDFRLLMDQAWYMSDGFYYDELNRVTSVWGTGGTTLIEYDAMGNITSHSDVGTYNYGENGAPSGLLTSVDGIRQNTYGYDANGRLSHTGNGGSQIQWTSTGLMKAFINLDSMVASAFFYAPGGSRYSHIQIKTIQGVRQVVTTHYVGQLYEVDWNEDSNPVSKTSERHFIHNGERVVAIITHRPGEIDEVMYPFTDHLGSVDVVTDEAGQVIERYSYDMFGKRRGGSDWMPDPTDALLSTDYQTDRGFTGHEHLDHLGLIHMNGRVYNPIIGRFISPDPYIPQPYNGQSHNRYSYVLNNPLRYTDPTGYSPRDEMVVTGTRYPTPGFFGWEHSGFGRYDGLWVTETVTPPMSMTAGTTSASEPESRGRGETLEDHLRSPRPRDERNERARPARRDVIVVRGVRKRTHRYQIGPTLLCWTSQSGCTLSNAVQAVDPISVPFKINPDPGYNEIGPFNDPIEHNINIENHTISNITLDGHLFHPGQVIHQLTIDKGRIFMKEGIYLTTVGAGEHNSWMGAAGNYIAGQLLFRPVHTAAPVAMWQFRMENP